MSGYDGFTWWINKNAGYAICNDGVKREIEDAFFTSSPVHNSDNFNIRFKDGFIGQYGDIDFEELRKRYNKSLEKQ